MNIVEDYVPSEPGAGNTVVPASLSTHFFYLQKTLGPVPFLGRHFLFLPNMLSGRMHTRPRAYHRPATTMNILAAFP